VAGARADLAAGAARGPLPGVVRRPGDLRAGAAGPGDSAAPPRPPGGRRVKVLFCHPSGLMYTQIYLRLEPLGVELVAEAARRAGHDVRILDLQVFTRADYLRVLADWRPDAVCFGVNYLANIPEVVDLAKETRRIAPEVLFF